MFFLTRAETFFAWVVYGYDLFSCETKKRPSGYCTLVNSFSSRLGVVHRFFVLNKKFLREFSQGLILGISKMLDIIYILMSIFLVRVHISCIFFFIRISFLIFFFETCASKRFSELVSFCGTLFIGHFCNLSFS